VPTIFRISYPTAVKSAPRSTGRNVTGRRGSRTNSQVNTTVSAATASAMPRIRTAVPIPQVPSSPTQRTSPLAAAVPPVVSASEITIDSPSPTSAIRSCSFALKTFSLVCSQDQTNCSAVRRLPTQPSPAYATPTSEMSPIVPRLSTAVSTASESCPPIAPGTFVAIEFLRSLNSSGLCAST
jgi:hypothetical protein